MATVNQVGKAAPTAKAPGVNVISVRLPRHDIPKKYSILKFNVANNVDFTNCGQTKLERENNFKEFKSAYDLETMPKFGAGSEYGREQKEEARKKKFGIKIRKYNPHDQPWLLKLGSGKQARRFKGIRKGGVLENASYYIFTQRPDGAFEASPVDEWFDFLPQAKYKALTAEEAEEQFNKRGKTLNHFAIMVRNRIKGAEGGDDEAEAEPGEKKKKGKKGKTLTLTDGDEWADSDDDENEDDEGNAEDKDKDDEEKPKKKKKEKKKKEKGESDNEAFEEQDEFDEGKEQDYSSGSSSDDEQMYDETGRDDKYEQKGVVDEDGLRKLLDTDEEDEEEEKKDEENEEDDEDKAKEDQNKASDSESSSDSDIDSDPEKDFTSPLLLSKHADETGNMTSNRSTTPLPDAGANAKRKKPDSQSPTLNAAKKPKVDSAAGSSTTPAPPAVASSSNSSSSTQGEGGIEGLVKRYLTRKPMTLKDLLQKISSKSMQTTEQIAKEVGHILQRLKLDKLKANNKMYFSIKKDSNS